MPSDSRIILVTGTDTGVGKTFVTASLARALMRRDRQVLAIKPIESGCGADPEMVEDGVLLAKVTGQDAPCAALLRFPRPVAPPLAAEELDHTIEFEPLVEQIRRYAAHAEVTLVEGAGGLLAPLTWEHTVLDLAHRLGASALVVSLDRLGTLNHTRLTVRALEDACIPVLGVVLNAPEVADNSTGSNAWSLNRLPDTPRVTLLPRVSDIDAAADSLGGLTRWLWR